MISPTYKQTVLLKHTQLIFVLWIVDIHTIKEIRCGQSTKGFELQGKNPEIEDRAFSIIYVVEGEYKNLDLVAPSFEDRSFWVDALNQLITMEKFEDSQDDTNILRKLWDSVNSSKKNGDMDLEGITVMLKKLNIKLSKSEVKSALKNMSISTKSLTFGAFEKYYSSLKERPEMVNLFNIVSEDHSEGIDYEQFRSFVLNVQKVIY